ncbi:unnamed protein product [Prunus armeniaca]|uniref:Uncharacterized protein n=1 Tax=Prunus armeniaca TaxID=36596 RepID=A0A6J5TH12_PRUAR|nr:unnamed protein product [Prunus armeniaca]
MAFMTWRICSSSDPKASARFSGDVCYALGGVKLLDAECSGEAHQAGFGQFIDCCCVLQDESNVYVCGWMSQGYLYGISPTTVRAPTVVIHVPSSRPSPQRYWQHAPVILRRPCFPVAAPRVYHAPFIHSFYSSHLSTLEHLLAMAMPCGRIMVRGQVVAMLVTTMKQLRKRDL